MTHSHSHEPVNYNRAFIISVTLNLSFVVIEAVSGILANSLGCSLMQVITLAMFWGYSLLGEPVFLFVAYRLPGAPMDYGALRFWRRC
jgi:hypothetical protein